MLLSNKPVCCACSVLHMIFNHNKGIMSCYKESCFENNEKLKLTGSQINLTSRSDQTVLGPLCYRNRPCSAAHSCRTHVESKAQCIRPKSAECTSLSPSKCDSFQRNFTSSDKLPGDSTINISHFTDSSSKLLQNLLETPSHMTPVFEGSSLSETFSVSSDSESEDASMGKHLEPDNTLEFLRITHLSTDSKFQNTIQKESNVKDSTNFTEAVEEKTVRFCEEPQLELASKKKFGEKCSCLRGNENFYSCLKNKFKSSCQEPQICQKWGRLSDEANEFDVQKTGEGDDPCEKDMLKINNSDTEPENLKGAESNDGGTSSEKLRNTPRERIINKSDKAVESPSKALVLPTSETNPVIDAHAENKSTEKPLQRSKEESREKYGKHDTEVNKKDEKLDCAHQKIDVSDSTYDEIVRLLRTLDEEDSEMHLDGKQDSTVDITAVETSSPKEKIDYFTAVSSYLEEVERNDNSFHENFVSTEKWNSKHFTSPRLEELINKNSVELAHEVFTLKIQIEDQKKGIKLLKDTLAEMKEAKKLGELEHQEALQKVSLEAETLVQRHQKFIKQLLNEKKNLNETVSKLVEDLKSGEERYKKNIKAMEEKHLIEVKRAKEAQAVADKIKREKWMENKTQKIKEMTVKGLEPELSRMAARQQEEVTELRNLHKAELEAVELRAARRTSELMDELRAELTKEKERAIAKETAALRTTMEKDFEDERNKFQQYYQSLKERIRKQEEKLSNQEYEFQQRLSDYKQEEEKKKQKVIREHEENLEEIRRQHLVEIRNLKEAAEAEKEVALNNFKKVQAIKFNEREAELHQQFKKERDQEIEMVIETLEKESTQVQLELNKANEGKMKRLKDKMEAEIKEIEASETALKDKLTETKSKLAEKEDVITELNSQMRQLQTELTFLKKSCDEMSLEKTKLKEVIRGEFESSINGYAKEKENLEKDIAVMKELHLKELAKKDQQNVQAKYEMQKELTRVYSRIKTAVNKKEKIIESLREENEAVNQKCRQLEFLLDQQRRNLLLQ